MRWCNKHLSFSPVQNDSGRCLHHPFPILKCHSLNRVSMTLHLNVAIYKVLPQAAQGNHTDVCRHTGVWIVTDYVWDGSSGRHQRKRHRLDLFISPHISKSPISLNSLVQKLQRKRGLFEKQLATEHQHLCIPSISRIWAMHSSWMQETNSYCKPRLVILV